jgi:hypothetical protein
MDQETAALLLDLHEILKTDGDATILNPRLAALDERVDFVQAEARQRNPIPVDGMHTVKLQPKAMVSSNRPRCA